MDISEAHESTNSMAAYNKMPLLGAYIRSRGWHYILSWLHRLTGIGLVLYLMVHINTLSSLYHPALYNLKMSYLSMPIFVFLAWTSSLVVIFHALNGGRLILYESFNMRNDQVIVKWTFLISAAYSTLLAILMIIKNQTVSATFYWMITIFVSVVVAYIVASRIWKTSHSIFWKLQRISGAFLIIAIPAHLIFSHMNPEVAHDAHVVLARMRSIFIRIVDFLMAASALYHSGYGLFSVTADYVSKGTMRNAIIAMIAVAMCIMALLAVGILVMI